MRIMFIDLTTALHSVGDLKSTGRGGMVSSLHLLPDQLAGLGHNVSVFSDAKQGARTSNGVNWLVQSDLEWITKQDWDFVILNRQTYQDGWPDIRARRRVLWVHDMVHAGWIQNPERIPMLSGVVYMSEYSRETWMSYYRGLQAVPSFLIPNGVDRDLFRPRVKDKNLMIYCSAPNRGLSHLPLILDTVRNSTGLDLTMRAYSNMGKLHPQELRKLDDKFVSVYDEVKAGGVDLRDPVPQKELAGELGRAYLMVKPNDYAETCSNTTLQALSCGTPVITTPLAADREWVKHEWNGLLTRHTLQDGPLMVLEMCRNVIRTLKDERLWEKLHRNGPRTKNLFTWEEIGRLWEKMFRKLK